MLQTLQDNLESFEAIKQDELASSVVLRMSALSQAGKLGPFLSELAHDAELDERTKGTLYEIAEDPNFLFAVEDYLHRTEIVH